MRAETHRNVYTSISITPEARDQVRAGARKLSYVLGRRVGMSEAIGIMFSLLGDPEQTATLQRKHEL
jgi:hypothetical protein